MLSTTTTCKGCLHFEACKSFAEHDGLNLSLWTDKNGLWCAGEHFKDRYRFAELPCPIGTIVYIIGYKYRQGVDEWWVNTGAFRFSDMEKMGKTVFFDSGRCLKCY